MSSCNPCDIVYRCCIDAGYNQLYLVEDKREEYGEDFKDHHYIADEGVERYSVGISEHGYIAALTEAVIGMQDVTGFHFLPETEKAE